MAEFKPPEKEGVISMANSLAHTKWMCKYHMGASLKVQAINQ
jgi:hypothetical protein